MRRLSTKDEEILNRIDRLSDDTLVSVRIASVMTSLSEAVWRKKPPIKVTKFGPQKWVVNLGQLRRFIRNGGDK